MTLVWIASWPGILTAPGTSPQISAPASAAHPPLYVPQRRVWRRETSPDVLHQVRSLVARGFVHSVCSGVVSAHVFVLADPVAALDLVLLPENNIQLPCQPHSNLAQVLWRFSDRTLHSNSKYYIYGGGLLILNASESDAGLYACDSVEQISSRTYNRTVAVYRLQLYSNRGAGSSSTPGSGVKNSSDSFHSVNTAAPGPEPKLGIEEPLSPENQSDTSRVTQLEVAVALLSLLSLCLMGVIFWIWTRGNSRCFTSVQSASASDGKRQSAEYTHIPTRASEIKLLPCESGRPCSANNNHCGVDFKGNGEHRFTPMANISSLDGLGFINDESEIWHCWGTWLRPGPTPVH